MVGPTFFLEEEIATNYVYCNEGFHSADLHTVFIVALTPRHTTKAASRDRTVNDLVTTSVYFIRITCAWTKGITNAQVTTASFAACVPVDQGEIRYEQLYVLSNY